MTQAVIMKRKYADFVLSHKKPAYAQNKYFDMFYAKSQRRFAGGYIPEKTRFKQGTILIY
ncbi:MULTISPECIES: hypothetical protein [Xenorhabdus]|uniref:Uncharacterized protein n=3 Tax=Xenorhabdus TaxID=626 RepID=A0ABT5LNN2_9GAMM|nr:MULTISPECIES: hypothetical protein [Xenorhabdus]MDC9587745.1 hypothetical protein [Xenorhabdus yunnanensis]MDC9596032.1 hypothetical protein [Xenorhabdus anantnagensis]